MLKLLFGSFLLVLSTIVSASTPFDPTDQDWTYMGNRADKDGSYWAYFIKESSVQTNPNNLDEKAVLMDDINSKERALRTYVVFFECSKNVFELDSIEKVDGLVVQRVVLGPKHVTENTIMADIRDVACQDITKT